MTDKETFFQITAAWPGLSVTESARFPARSEAATKARLFDLVETVAARLWPDTAADQAQPDVPVCEGAGLIPPAREPTYRVGRSLGRTLYRHVNGEDVFIGIMDTAEWANKIALALNNRERRMRGDR